MGLEAFDVEDGRPLCSAWWPVDSIEVDAGQVDCVSPYVVFRKRDWLSAAVSGSRPS